MPTYDYHCLACEHAFALEHSMKEAPRRKCPKCGRNQLERRIGAGAGIVFKGSGFYLTDYRSKAYQEAAKADSKDAPKAEAPKPDAAKTDSDASAKPAETKPAKAEPSTTPAKPAASKGKRPKS